MFSLSARERVSGNVRTVVVKYFFKTIKFTGGRHMIKRVSSLI